MKIVIVNGYPGCGKTTFELFCKDIMGPYCRSRSTVDKIKALARRGGWDGRKTPEARKLLSDLKDLFTQFNDMPFQDIVSHLEQFKAELTQYGVEEQSALFFVDSREPQELKRFREELGAIVIFIQRDNDGNFSNHADANVENFDYDYIIDNNGTLEDLKVKAKKFLNLIFPENNDII